MSLSTAMFTGLTGLDVHSRQLDVISNNISNSNTPGFKSSRSLFETQLSDTLSRGTGPDGDSGGTLPSQIGLGVDFGGTQRDHTNGSIQPTGVKTHMALEGDGFFALRQGNNSLYTRNGTFDLNSNNKLVAPNGGVVQGYGIDDNFNVERGALEDITIPLGDLTVAEATRNVSLDGNLNASGPTATRGAEINSQALNDATTGAAATAASQLTDLEDAGSGASLFSTGDVITLKGAEKGGKSIGTFKFEVGPTNTSGADDNGETLGDFTAFLDDVMGIDDTVDGAGVSVDGSTGGIRIDGNFGEVNDIALESPDITSDGAPAQPFLFNKAESANGESVRTNFVAYDSLGTPITVDLSLVQSSKGPTGTTWRYYAESLDDTDLERSLGNGTVQFDTFGRLSSVTGQQVQIDRTGTGAVDPLSINLDFKEESFTALTDTASSVAAVNRDGSPVGTLDSFSIGEDGTINGAFSNGLTRPLGQVSLATFTNPEGLVEVGANMFEVGPNSGIPVQVEPQSMGGGRVVPGAIELSNVDLSEEFVSLISANTGYSASSRVIRTSEELIQQLLAIAQ